MSTDESPDAAVKETNARLSFETLRLTLTVESEVTEDVVEGLENAPKALIGLLAGDNKGKRMVRVAADPS